MPEPIDTTQPIAPPAAGGDGAVPPVTEQIRPAATSAEAPPRVADGVELIGQMKGSGYKDPPFMARRQDGQMVQLAPILYLVAERSDGQRTYEQIGAEVSEAVGRGLDADGVKMLVEEKLRPLGVLAAADGSSPEVQKQDPFLALKFKTALIPPGLVRAITVLFRPLFWPPVILAVLAGLIAFDAWFFFGHGLAESMRQIIYQPLYLILTFGFIILTAAFHETGHATGCRYGGAEPGAMGAGLYIVWPAFYTDVTDSYRLGRGGRLRTDLGGVYFNAVMILALAGTYFGTGFEPLLIPVLLAHLEIFRQLLPLLRLDGYYVLSDLTGVPDLFTRIKPILVSFVPWKRSDPKVKELKWWVRLVVSLWVLIFVAFLAFNVTYILMFAPRIFATGWDSFQTHLDQTSTAFGSGETASGAAGVIKLIALALPALGIAFGFGRGGTRLTRGLWTKTKGRPVSRFASIVAVGGLIAAVAAVWWPDGDYVPIREGEEFTVQTAAVAVRNTAEGSPAFEEAASDEPPEEPLAPPSAEPSEEPDAEPSLIEGSTSPSISPSPPATVSPSPTMASPTPTMTSSSSSPSPQTSPTPTSEG